jgi:hypothetical protein
MTDIGLTKLGTTYLSTDSAKNFTPPHQKLKTTPEPRYQVLITTPESYGKIFFQTVRILPLYDEIRRQTQKSSNQLSSSTVQRHPPTQSPIVNLVVSCTLLRPLPAQTQPLSVKTALTFSAMIRSCLGHSLRIVQETQTTSDTSHIPAQSPKSTASHEVNARLPCRCDFLDLTPRCALRDDTGLSRITPISYPDLTLPATPCCNCNVVLATFPCCCRIESVVAASMK